MKKKMVSQEVVIGYKGFNKELKCREFQFELGKEYEQTGNLKVCANGFHFCELPLSVLSYYPFADGNQYAIVEARGKVETEGDKSVTDKILIKSKIDIAGIVKASVEVIWNKAKKGGLFKKSNATSGNDAHSATSGKYAHSATSGNDAHSATSGYGAHSATSGNRANSATSGYGAHSATSGNDAIACSIGRKASAKATVGCWLVLAEWKEGESFTDAKPVAVKATQVDGKKIKADTFYKLEGGKFIEVTE